MNDKKVQIAGEYITGNIEQFLHRADVLLDEEQRKISPNNALIAFFCDTVRMTREYLNYVAQQPATKVSNAVLDGWDSHGRGYKVDSDLSDCTLNVPNNKDDAK